MTACATWRCATIRRRGTCRHLVDPIVRSAIARIDIVQGGKSGSRGTGFLVAPDLVLTAVHVVADRSAATLTLLPGRITLTFPTHTTEATVVDGLVDPHADWVLLRCATPPASVRPIPLADTVEDGALWETYGFPDANPRDGLAQIGTVTNATGTFEGVTAFQLFSDQAAGGSGAPVKGASGGPVIVGGAVVGLLRASLMKEGLNVAGTLYGCPVALVLDRSGDLLPIPDPVRGLPGLPRAPLPASPFRFLERFTSQDAEIFAGRNREIRRMYEQVVAGNSASVLLLFGQSGSGKSSFLDAGLLPRLQTTHATVYLRRDRTKGLLQTLFEGIATALPLGAARASMTPADALRLAWLGTETAAGRPLVVVLDQVEEVFTLPSEDANELTTFADALAQLFAAGGGLRGRLVLSFRKEWFAEIQKQLDARSVDYGKVFLESLDAEAVAEIVSALQRTKRLRDRYGFEVEPGLAAAIARDLTADRDSPVAPTLQVLLSRMWEEAIAASATAPRFTAALYERVRTAGFLLANFLDQQLDAVAVSARGQESRADIVESGLALDVLVFHTTPYATAEQRTLDEVRTEFAHRPADAEWLIQELKRVYLLTDPAGDARDTANAARLAHDTLAQVVRARFDKSGHPGQRARRILENRAAEWTDGRTGTPLDSRDLALVEQGLPGMRALHANEAALVNASRAERDRERGRKRLRRVAIAGAAAGVLAAAGMAMWFGLQTRKQMEWRDMLTLDARIPSLLSTDPVAGLIAAITVVDRGLKLSGGTLPVGLQVNFANALDRARERQSWSLPSDATALAFSSDGRIAAGSGDGLIHLFHVGEPAEIAPIRAAGDSAIVRSVSFSADAAYLAAALGRQGVGVWDRSGQPLTTLPKMPDGIASVVRFVPPGADAARSSHTLVALFTPSEFSGRSIAYICDLDTGDASTAAIATANAIESLAVARRSRGDVWAVTGSSVGANGEMQIWDVKTGKAIWTQPETTSKGGFTAVDIFISPDTSHTVLVAGGASDGTVSLWDVTHQTATLIGPFDERPTITSLAFGGQGHIVLAGTSNGFVRWLALDGTDALFPFPASSSPVIALATSPGHEFVAVGGASLELHRVRVVDQIGVAVQFPLRHSGPAESRVNDMAFALDTHRLVVAGRDRVTSWDVDLPRGAPWSTPTMMDIEVAGKESRGVAVGRGGEMLIVAEQELQFHGADGRLTFTAPLPARGTAIAVTSDGRTAAVGDDAGYVTTWDVAHKVSTGTLPAHKGSVLAVAFNTGGDRLATAAEDGRLRIWNLGEGHLIFDQPNVSATALGWASDGTLFVGHKDGQLGHRRADGSSIVSVPISRGELITSVFVQHIGGDSVFVSGKSGVSRFDVESGAVLPVLAHGKDIRAVAGSADGRLFAAVDAEGEVLILRADWREWLSESCDRLRQHDVFLAHGSSAHCRPDGASYDGANADTRSVYGVDCREAYDACVARAWKTGTPR